MRLWRGFAVGQAPEEIIKELDTSEGYVNNVKSQLKIKYGIVFTRTQNRLHETQDPNAIDAESHTNQQAAPVIVDQAGLAPHEPHNDELNTPPTPTMKGPESQNTNPELQTLRHEVSGLESRVSEEQEMMALSQKKQRLAAREILVSGERELQSAVSDICPAIDMMWKTKEAYVEVMVRIYRHPLCRWIIVHGTPFWVYDLSEHRLRLVLEEIYDLTSLAWKTKRLASKTILTDSLVEFVDYHAIHPLCPIDYMPGGSLKCRWLVVLP